MGFYENGQRWREGSINESRDFEGAPKGLRAYGLAFDIQPGELEDKTILDLGANKTTQLARDLRDLGSSARVVSLSPDYSFSYVRNEGRLLHREIGRSVSGLAQELPFKDGSFDFVFSLHLYEHISWDDFKAGMLETARVLYKHGKGFFTPTNIYGISSYGYLKEDESFIGEMARRGAMVSKAKVNSGYGIMKVRDLHTNISFGRVPIERIDIHKI